MDSLLLKSSADKNLLHSLTNLLTLWMKNSLGQNVNDLMTPVKTAVAIPEEFRLDSAGWERDTLLKIAYN
jgi:hypothetical protein